MANGLRVRAALAIVGFALGCAPMAPAKAQFMSGSYPVIVVPPPPAQSMVMPRRQKLPAPAPAPQAPANASEPRPLNCHYQGQTRVCE